MLFDPILAPSLLAADHSCLGQAIRLIEDKHLKWVHWDIMDGHFVPNLSFGPQMLRDLRHQTNLFFDTHLMLEQPHRYVDVFIDGGSQQITIHVEPDYPIQATLAHIRQRGCSCGIAINPDTPAEALQPYLQQVDLVLVMTVQPGFGGQSFRQDVLPKIAQLHDIRQKNQLPFRLEVDGGIDVHTAILCQQAGADVFVAGSAFFNSDGRLLDFFSK